MGWVVNATPQPLYSRESDPVAIVQEAGWVPGVVWTGAENLACTRIRSPDRPDRSQSLYRLSYPDPHKFRSLSLFNFSIILLPAVSKFHILPLALYSHEP
jgi:hypothetical protein